MILSDVNVLIYAFRPDSAHHAACKAWLESVVAGEPRFGMSPLALSAVVRITTHPRIYKEPSSIHEVLAYCDALLGKPNCEIIKPSDRHWAIFTRLVTETNVRGARVTDAWFAALAIEHGCTWITYDRDFARFPELDWKLPAT
jgi:uncharacterized protein